MIPPFALWVACRTCCSVWPALFILYIYRLYSLFTMACAVHHCAMPQPCPMEQEGPIWCRAIPMPLQLLAPLGACKLSCIRETACARLLRVCHTLLLPLPFRGPNILHQQASAALLMPQASAVLLMPLLRRYDVSLGRRRAAGGKVEVTQVSATQALLTNKDTGGCCDSMWRKAHTMRNPDQL